ncbi:MAG: hypothetical protein HLUCCO18_15735 [Rhodobacteraceae bacterium HLUCCO18]|nr:MAG: hypothetical protein HLUCCO18_15735 [Rhodobacteraceae bacterium HLUCCO18]
MTRSSFLGGGGIGAPAASVAGSDSRDTGCDGAQAIGSDTPSVDAFDHAMTGGPSIRT